MLKITLGVDGMMCGMCESHVNDAVRKAFTVSREEGHFLSRQGADGYPHRAGPR